MFLATMSPATYVTIENTPFVAPANPGVIYIAVANLTGPQMDEQRRQHKELLREYNLYHNTDLALKKQLIGAVERIYIRTLEN